MNFKLNSKKRLYIYASILIIFIILIVYFLILPSINKVKETHVAILNQKIELKQSIDQGKNLSQLGEKINKIKPELEKLNKIFINKNRELDFITSLESIADEFEVKQEINLNPGKKEKESEYEISPITINLEGTYLNILQYLKEMESLEYYINVNSININSIQTSKNHITDNKNNKSNINMIINANIYWKK